MADSPTLKLPPLNPVPSSQSIISTVERMVPKKARRINIAKNGDSFFRSRTMLIPAQTLSFPQMLDKMTDVVKADFAIHRLYTPQTGTQITNMDDLKEDCVYVAAGKERFKSMVYSNNRNSKPLGTRSNTEPASPTRQKKLGKFEILATSGRSLREVLKNGCYHTKNSHHFQKR